ncbi:unnamed protein product, partial [Prorocentrum cordatum]
MEDVKSKLAATIREEEERDEELLKQRLAEKDAEIEKHKGLLAFTQKRFDTMIDRQGLEHEQGINRVRLEHMKERDCQKGTETQLRTEHATLVRGLEFFERDFQRIEMEQSASRDEIRKLKEQSEELSKLHGKLSAERAERVTLLSEKERKIDSYKEKVSVLKKFKQHLDQKCNEAMELNQPKDAKIEQLNADLGELEAEFEVQLLEQRNLKDVIDAKKQHARHLTCELEKLRGEIRERDRTIASYSNDLHKLVSSGGDESTWPHEIRRLYHVHALGEGLQNSEKLPVEEMQREMRQVERKVSSLANKGGHMKGVIKADIQRKAQEGAELTRELNELRVQKKSLQREVRSLEQRVALMEQPSEAHPAIEDGTERPEGGSLPALRACPPPARPGGVPQPLPPSGGAPPGPRQQSASPVRHLQEETPGSATLMRKSGSGPLPRAPPRRPKDLPLTLQATTEEQKRMQSLLLTAEVSGQQLKLQEMENRALRQRIDALLDQVRAEDAGRAAAGG